jgi:hypothetical protein
MAVARELTCFIWEMGQLIEPQRADLTSSDRLTGRHGEELGSVGVVLVGIVGRSAMVGARNRTEPNPRRNTGYAHPARE